MITHRFLSPTANPFPHAIEERDGARAPPAAARAPPARCAGAARAGALRSAGPNEELPCSRGVESSFLEAAAGGEQRGGAPGARADGAHGGRAGEGARPGSRGGAPAGVELADERLDGGVARARDEHLGGGDDGADALEVDDDLRDETAALREALAELEAERGAQAPGDHLRPPLPRTRARPPARFVTLLPHQLASPRCLGPSGPSPRREAPPRASSAGRGPCRARAPSAAGAADAACEIRRPRPPRASSSAFLCLPASQVRPCACALPSSRHRERNG